MRDDWPTRLGIEMAAQRRRLGLSGAELARRTGLSRGSVSMIERGAARPSVRSLWAIAAVLELSLDRVFFGERLGHAGLVARAANRGAVRDRRWGLHQRLDPRRDARLELVLATYQPGSTDPIDLPAPCHGVLVSGTLHLRSGGEGFELWPGDACRLAAGGGHHLENRQSVAAHMIWMCFDVVPDRAGEADLGRQPRPRRRNFDHRELSRRA